jgi:signal transduction histidine kinase
MKALWSFRRPIPLLGVLGVVATVAVALAPTLVGAPVPPLLQAVHVLVGASFVFVGLFAWHRRPKNRTGAIMAGVGFAWFLPHVGIIRAALPFTIAAASASLYQAVVAHLALTYPTGRAATRLERRTIAGVYAWVIAGGIAGQLLWDPRAYGCRGCSSNLLLVTNDRAVNDRISMVTTVVTVLVVLTVMGLLVRRWLAVQGRGRRAFGPVFWVAGPIAALFIAQDIAEGVNASQPVARALFGYAPIILVALPLGYLVALLRSRLDRSAVGDLVVELEQGITPGGLTGALRRALGDPSATLAFRIAGSDRFIDPDGLGVVMSAQISQRSVTYLDEGRTTALQHDRALADEPELVRAVAAAAHLALQNERLQAEVKAQLEEVRASRARIVKAGDEERRRVERDLHDGAQQRLVTLSLALRMAQEQAAGDRNGALAATLAEAVEEVRLALWELRELARGLHPTILTEAGLGPALESLAERSIVPARVEDTPAERLPAPVEATAYFVVSEALANVAKYSEAGSVTVRARRQDGGLVVEVRDDGVGGADPAAGSGLRGLADRVAALDGMLRVESPPGGGTLVVAEIPCV